VKQSYFTHIKPSAIFRYKELKAFTSNIDHNQCALCSFKLPSQLKSSPVTCTIMAAISVLFFYNSTAKGLFKKSGSMLAGIELSVGTHA
jgi:hypothetical protein